MVATELFFSEYVEGSSLNKALEIANFTGSDVDLSEYSIAIYFNGSTSAGTTIPLMGTLANGELFVVADDGADPAILAVADATTTSSLFNGDDAIALLKNDIIIDVFGQIGVDPGSSWPGGGADVTLRRLASVTAGDTDPTDSFDASLEWESFPQDTFDGLGSHTIAGISAQALVINEVLGSTAGTDVEYIELFGEAGTSLDGLSIIVVEGDDGSPIGSIDARVDLGADDVVGDNGFFLIGNSLVSSTYGVTPDQEIALNFIENSSYTIALVETSSLTGTVVSGSEVVLDAVGVTDGDAGDTFFFNAPVVGPDGPFLPAGVRRVIDGVDTDTVNDWVLADFNLGTENTPTAGTSENGTSENGDGDDAPLTLISAIQSTGPVSPLVGSTVTIEAVVVGDFQDGPLGTNGDFNGFFVQEEDTDADGNDATSEGLFIFDGNSPAVDVKVGDLVRVTGTVSEFFGETQLSGVAVTVVDDSDNSSLVTPATITFPVANTITNSDGVFIADLEAYEGMLVTIPQTLTVADLFTLGRFGDIGLHADGRLETYTQANSPSVSGFQAYQDLGVRNTVMLDDGSTIQNPATIPFEIPSDPGNIAGQWDANDELSVGDTVTNLTGVVRFSRGSGGFGDEIYRINPTGTVDFVNTNPRPTEAPAVGGNITVAAFNVLNFFTSLKNEGLTSGPAGLAPRGADNPVEFDRQLDKLVAALAEIQADVFGLVEIENEFGDINDDGQFAIGFLANALNAAIPGANYQFADPGTDYVGNDAIAVGFIYDANTVKIADGTTVAVLTDSDLAALGVDPGNPVFEGEGTSRSPIAATFEEIVSGERFTATVNHFKSKGSISPFGNNAGIGDGTGNNNEARLQAAIALDAWLKSDPTGSGDPDVLILGDLNAYGMEDPIQYLLNNGYADQVKRFLETGDFEYSFGFPLNLDTSPQVQAFGALDYVLATESLAAQITGAAEWHINADEASALDYNTNFKPDEQINDLFGANPFRSSDHDPLIIGLNLASLNQPPVLGNNSLSVVEGQPVVLTNDDLSATDAESDDSALVFTLSNVQNGSFNLTTFTQQDIADGLVTFTPDGSENTPAYSVSVSDGTFSTAPAAANITFDVTQNDTIIIGTENPDVLTPTGDESFVVQALAGDDTIVTNGGNDVIIAGAGADTITTGAGKDTIVFAGPWFDERVDLVTDFDVSHDAIDLFAILDTDNHTSNDPFAAYIRLDERDGNTTVAVNPRGDSRPNFFRSMVVLQGTTGLTEANFILTEDGSTPPGDPGDPGDPGEPGDPIDPIDPIDNDDPFVITGDNGKNQLSAPDGSNYELLGLGSRDRLVGNTGNDILDGGDGPDSLTGGGGSDTFRFTSASEGRDTVEDFEVGLDQFDLSAIFTGSQYGFTTSQEIFDNYVRLQVKSDRTFVQVDVAGDNGDDFQNLALVRDVTNLSVADFTLV